jgi:hypothetical protein
MDERPPAAHALRDLARLRRVRENPGRRLEIVEEPTEQPYGVRDCAIRNPAGNLLRLQERR